MALATDALYSGGRELARAAAALNRGLDTERNRKRHEAWASAGQQVDIDALVQQLADAAQSVAGAQGPAGQRRPPAAGMQDLAAAAQQYAAASAAAPHDFDLVYYHALVLQEMASRLGADRAAGRLAAMPAGQREGRLESKVKFLQQACERYEAAWKLQRNNAAALYNWGVALSDIALSVKASDPERARQCLAAAAKKYDLSLSQQPNNPQALNNWGLVLRELSLTRPLAEASSYLREATSKFRRALRLNPEFDRACYNLGTVLFNHATLLQTDSSNAASWSVIQEHMLEGGNSRWSREDRIRRLQALAGQYIILAYAVQPTKDVYIDSLRRSEVCAQMPLPYLRAGYLTVPDAVGSCVERWTRRYVVIDTVSLRSASEPNSLEARGARPLPAHVYVLVSDLHDAHRCADPSLPKGAALWVALKGRPQGLYLVADSEDEAEAWTDALHMLAHVAAKQQLQHVEAVLLRHHKAALAAAQKPAGGQPAVSQSRSR